MLRKMCLLVACASVAATAQPTEQSQSSTSFTELTPRATLVAIIKGLNASSNGTVPDPRSMSDVVLCPPTRIKYSKTDGRPEKWYVAFSMNSRTSEGGFSGRVMYGAVFRRDRLPEIYKVQLNGNDPFNRLINDATQKTMKDCPIVPNDQLAALIGSSDRPTVDVSR